MMTNRGGEAPVAGKQRRVERFREGDVYGILGRNINPQFPDTQQKPIVRIPAEWKVGEVGKRRVELAGRRVTSNALCHFDIDQMGRVNCPRGGGGPSSRSCIVKIFPDVRIDWRSTRHHRPRR